MNLLEGNRCWRLLTHPQLETCQSWNMQDSTGHSHQVISTSAPRRQIVSVRFSGGWRFPVIHCDFLLLRYWRYLAKSIRVKKPKGYMGVKDLADNFYIYMYISYYMIFLLVTPVRPLPFSGWKWKVRLKFTLLRSTASQLRSDITQICFLDSNPVQSTTGPTENKVKSL